MADIQTELRNTAQKLFEEGTIEVLIGHEKGSLPLRTRPSFITKGDDAERLVWNSLCVHNLTAYLPSFYKKKLHLRKDEVQTFPKVGIVVRGCDFRALMLQARENQILRDHVTAIGVPCSGMADIKKIEKQAGGEVTGYEIKNGTVSVTTISGNSKDISVSDLLADACLECRSPLPEGADVLLEGTARESSAESHARAKAFEGKSRKERWDYFVQEMSKCIRCSACRQACPTCYCKECFADNTNPRWLSIGNDLSDVMMFHIGRIVHQAGRCVECDACVRACPMDIDLRTFTNAIVKDVEDLFGYVPGETMDEVPPLLAFSEDDNQNLVTDIHKQD